MIAKDDVRNAVTNSSHRQTFVAQKPALRPRVSAENAAVENIWIGSMRKSLGTNAFGGLLTKALVSRSMDVMACTLPSEHVLQFQTVSSRFERGLRKGVPGMSTANANARSSRGHGLLGSPDSIRGLAFGDSVMSQLTIDPALGHYTEDTFRFFLDVERRRAEISGRPFLLLLVDLKHESEPGTTVGQEAARLMSAALAGCVRETDFVGWYRSGRVLGAVLTQHTDAELANMTEIVTDRIGSALRQTLPLSLADRIQLRAYQLPPVPGRQS